MSTSKRDVAFDSDEGIDTLPGKLHEFARARPRAVGLRAKRLGIWEQWTWREISEEVRAVAHGLALAGLRQGDRVAHCGAIRPWSICALLAAQELGCDVVLLGERQDVHRLGTTLAEAGVRLAFAADEGDLHTLSDTGYFGSDRAKIVHGGSGRSTGAALEGATLRYGDVHNRGSVVSTDAHGLPRHANGTSRQREEAFVRLESSTGQSSTFAVRHEELLREAGRALARHRVAASDELLLAPDLDIAAALPAALAQWVCAGFRLNLPENRASWLADRREVGPTYEFYDSSSGMAEIEAVQGRMPPSGSWRRRVLDAAIEARARLARSDRRASDALVNALLGWWVLRPLRDVIGLSRVKRTVYLRNRPSGEVAAFHTGIGLASASDPAHRSVSQNPVVRDPEADYFGAVAFSAEVLPFLPGAPLAAGNGAIERAGSRVAAG